MSVKTASGILDEALAERNGLLRLETAWIARDFIPPGRRLGLPEDAYDMGERGFICERWLASTTKADNRIGPPDEGLSYIARDGDTRLSLPEAVHADPGSILGAEYASSHAGLGRLAKVFDYSARPPYHLHLRLHQAALVGRRSKDEAYYFPEGEAGAMTAVSHLIAAGHSRIGILTGPREMLTARERLDGYERALREHGIPVRPELIKAGSFLHDHAIEAATELLRSHPAPTAIFAANNVLAEGCLLALGGLKLKVPADVSLVTFDDVPWMSIVTPQLTTIRQPVADMAQGAAELLFRRLRDNGPASSTSVFRSGLVVRGSVAPIPKVQASP